MAEEPFEEVGTDITDAAAAAADGDAAIAEATALQPNDGAPIEVFTHSGRFHLDEMAAVALLSIAHGLPVTCRDGVRHTLHLTRTRDADVLAAAIVDPDAYVIDVGGLYNPDQLCFDHHQRTFDEAYSPRYEFPMSSCGLIWRHVGPTVLQVIAEKHGIEVTSDDDDRALASLVDAAYATFFAGIDANDNGVKHVRQTVFPVEFAYANGLALPGLVGSLNKLDPREPDTAFLEGVGMLKTLVEAHLVGLLRTETEYAQHEAIIRDCLAAGASPEILDLTTDFNDHPVHLVTSASINRYLKRHDPGQTVKFTLVRHGNSKEIRVHTVNYRRRDFQTYVPITGQQTNTVTFVHKNRFLACCTTPEVAHSLAQQSLDNYYAVQNYPARLWRWLTVF